MSDMSGFGYLDEVQELPVSLYHFKAKHSIPSNRHESVRNSFLFLDVFLGKWL